MNLDDIYQSSTIKAQDLKGREVTLTINGFQAVDFDEGKKLVLSFAETEKTLVCNKTNGTTIGQLYGSNVDSWIGKRITLFPTQTDWAGSQVACIRVKLQPAASTSTSSGHTAATRDATATTRRRFWRRLTILVRLSLLWCVRCVGLLVDVHILTTGAQLPGPHISRGVSWSFSISQVLENS